MLLLITAAGAGSRFACEGFKTPKPLIQVEGLSLLEHTLASFHLNDGDQVLIAVQRCHHVPAQLDFRLRHVYPGVTVRWLELAELLNGQLATAVRTLEFAAIPGYHQDEADTPLLIHNCDTAFSWQEHLRPPADSYGSMAVFPADGSHWSFGKPDPADGCRAIAIAEKRRISDLASIGLYGFRSARRFLLDARRQLSSADRLHGEYYVAPLLNRAIEAGETVLLPRVTGVRPYGTPAEVCTTFGVTLERLRADNP